MGVNYFDHENLSELGFADDADGKYARRVLLPLIEQGTRSFFNNVDCQVAVLESLEQVGFKKVISRQVYLLNVCDSERPIKRAIKIDRKLQRASGQFVWEELSTAEASEVVRIKQLYDSLYLVQALICTADCFLLSQF